MLLSFYVKWPFFVKWLSRLHNVSELMISTLAISLLAILNRTFDRRVACPSKAVVVVTVVVTLGTLLLGTTAEAQVLFNVLEQNGEQLRQINPNGSNNISLQIGNLPQEANPALSSDGRFLSVRSSDPARPNQFSTNVHVFDSSNGQLRKITDFQDSTDPQTGNTFNHSPRYTAFSPDGSMLAVSDFLNIQTNNQGASTTAFTSIYRVSNGAILVGPAINGSASTNSTLGVGISWSSATNRVATPSSASNGTTAIFSGNGLLNIPIRQETFPQIGTFSNGNSFENDSFPTYSPNGQALAYFRSRDFLTVNGSLPSALSLRITSPAGDRSIFNFNPGFQPTGISWSPDGSELAVGIGQQVSSGGFRFNLAEPSASEIAIVSSDGSAIRQLVAAPAFSPTWSTLQQNSPSGDYDNTGAVGQGDLDLVLLNWGRNAPPVPAGWINQKPSGLIGQAELDGVLLNWGGGNLSSLAVPEPTTVVLALLSLGGVVDGRRRRV